MKNTCIWVFISLQPQKFVCLWLDREQNLCFIWADCNLFQQMLHSLLWRKPWCIKWLRYWPCCKPSNLPDVGYKAFSLSPLQNRIISLDMSVGSEHGKGGETQSQVMLRQNKPAGGILSETWAHTCCLGLASYYSDCMHTHWNDINCWDTYRYR